MFTVEIVTPFGEFAKLEAERVVARAQEGDLAVLSNMIPLTTPLQIGRIKILTPEGEKTVTVSGGYMYNENNHLTIVTEAAEWADQIDIKRAEAALQRAEERMRIKSEDLDVKRAEIALKRALNRINNAR